MSEAPVAAGSVRCPMEPCPTDVQRTPDGTIADGMSMHLSTVHRLPADRIAVLVAKALKR